MTQCPKCQDSNIAGPSFCKTGMHGEHLLYVCRTCGYKHRAPTADQKHPDQIQALLDGRSS